MPKIPSLKPKLVIKLLVQYGFELKHITGSHHIFVNTTGKIVTVPVHGKDIPKGTLLSILDMAGIDRNSIRS